MGRPDAVLGGRRPRHVGCNREGMRAWIRRLTSVIASGRGKGRVTAGLAALAWLTVAALRVAVVPVDFWRWRDDGVITLSHAFGWVTSGVPSVSASGERIEGFSAPLEFFLGSSYYALGGRGWETLLDLQVVVGTLATGYFLARFLQHLFPGDARRPLLVVGVAASGVVGLLPWATSGWLVSGMENSLTLPLLAAAMAGFAGLERQRGWALGLALGLAGVSRTELAAMLLPALAAVGLLAATRRVPVVVAARVGVVTGAVWALVHAWRWHTFGSLLPNTALVQDKVGLAALSPGILLLPVFACLAVVALRRWPRLSGALWPTSIALVIASLLLTRLIGASDPEVCAAVVCVVAHLFVGVTLAGLGSGRTLGWAGCLIVGSVPLVQFGIFGGARLDSLRIFGMALPLLSTTTGALVLTFAARAHTLRAHVRRVALLAGIAATIGGGRAAVHAAKARELCCGVDGYRGVLATADVFRDEAGLPRVILANPDLGKVSFAKDVVVTDLGRLGDGLLTQVSLRHPTRIAALLDRVIAPDVVQVHDSWACYFEPWLRSPAFERDYVLRSTDTRPADPACLEGGAALVFVRRLDAPAFAREVDLTRRLVATPAAAPTLLASTLAACTALPGDALRCQWVRRAALRAGPELRAAGAYARAVDAFAASPAPELDHLLLTTPVGWSARAAVLLEPLLGAPNPPSSAATPHGRT